MLVRTLRDIAERHEITAGEAAGGLLFGTWQRGHLNNWEVSAMPNHDGKPWPITLLRCHALLVDSAGANRVGKVIYFGTLMGGEIDRFCDLHAAVQGACGKATWQGEADSDYGFGIGIYRPLVATDIIYVRFVYRERLA